MRSTIFWIGNHHRIFTKISHSKYADLTQMETNVKAYFNGLGLVLGEVN